MNTNYSTTPAGVGKAPSSAPNNLKYVFDLAKSVLFDVEVYPPGRWCCGFLSYDGKHTCVDGDRVQLTAILDKIHRAGRTLVGYNSRDYDIPILRAVLAGADVFQVSHALINYEGWGLPPELRDRAAHWPRIPADHIDLAARTRMNGRIPALKTIAANLGAKHLQELPYPPDQEPTDAEWVEVRKYNRKDLEATRLPLDHFAPELQAIAALSRRYGMDLRSVHQAGIASQILCGAYRDRHGQDPSRVEPPARVRYQPPGEVRRPQNPVAAAWYDRITTEAFPMILAKGASHPRPVLPEPNEQIVIGGITLNVGSGGIHSADGALLHRSTSEHAIYESDVASYYPSMMSSFGIAPSNLGDCGADLFAEILAERIKIKEQAATESNPAEATRLKTMAAGLKIVLNSVFGQMGNPYSVLYDPTSFLAVTLSGQLLLIDLLERLVGAGAEVLSVNTDGLFFRVRRTGDAWRGVLSDWQTDSGMTLETTEVQALAIEATNNYAVRYTDGSLKRRGTLGGSFSWRNVPNSLIVADAVVAGLLDGTLPERFVRQCADPIRFVNITRRDSVKTGVLINETTGVEIPLPRLTRWYKARNSPFRIEHRWTDADGKEHKTTPPGATSIQLLMDLPEPGVMLGDVDYNWYVGEARQRIFAVRDGFLHLDPKWLSGIAADLHARGLAPSPHWAGKHSPKGARKDQPSYFFEWQNYRTFGTYTGPKIGILVLDIDLPDKYRKWIEAPLWDPRDLDDCMVSYHRCDSPEAVRAGQAKGKLIFQFEVGADHPLARVGKAALRQALGIEIFYGHGDPSILGEHPDGPDAEYMLSDDPLGPPPDWLIADLVERATKKVRAPKEPKAPSGNGNGATSHPATVAKYAQAALENEVARVAAMPEGERNNGLFAASCRVGELVGAGALDQETAAEALRQATTLPPDEAATTIRNGLSRGMECPRDLSRIHRNGDGVEPANEAVNDPHRLARLYRDDRCLHTDKTSILRYWQGDFMRWEGSYRSIEDHEIYAELARFCKKEFDRANREEVAAWEEAGGVNLKGEPCPAPKCCKVSKTLIVNVALALGGYELLDGRTEDPSWLIEDPPFPAHEILPCKNFLVHLPSWVAGGGSAAVREPHPNFFARHALDYDFDPEAPEPVEWLHFLGSRTIPDHPSVHQLWPDDRESVDALQEWFGYLLVPDVSQHKILLLVGPTRCGKGTIARVLQALVGIANVANPTLSGLGTQFGLQPLVGKMVAIIADARMSGRSDMAQITENLLSISGEDTRTIDRKHKTSITAKLNTRFLMLSNQIPRLVDESGALANRFIILKLARDFLGREDHELTDRLLAELPGILLWAIEGWHRLKDRGYFLQPKSGDADVELMHDSSSPVGAFLRESCILGPEHTIAITDLYGAWKAWCLSKGREKYTGDEHTFGRNLNAACPTVIVTRPRSEGGRKRHYQGIALLPPNAATDATPF